jgi:hypothetical protein
VDEGTVEARRLADAAGDRAPWKLWGPYLAERQWGTVREDYSADGSCWAYFPHDHARSRAYRWGEDGLLAIGDDQCRLNLGLALWNERDPILKERLFGLTGPEGNHGEDVKELYYYLDATPTHSYLKALYKYPQGEFPYATLVQENARRSRAEPEFELSDAGAFDDNRYFDVQVEYAKAAPDDVLVAITVTNRGPDRARAHVLPTLWFRNTWGWGRTGENYPDEAPVIERRDDASISATHTALGRYVLFADAAPDGRAPQWLFTGNDTNTERLYGTPGNTPWAKDAFHRRVVNGDVGAVNPAGIGTKACAWHEIDLAPQESAVLRLRLAATDQQMPFGAAFDAVLSARRAEADAFHAAITPAGATAEERLVLRQARAGLLWSKQFFYYDVPEWLAGDPAQPPPPEGRRHGRNAEWMHLNNRDIISMPDKWEYPWYAAWDLAFHMLPFARLDPDFAKDQLVLLLREWYMHPNGQLPAYEFAFGDVNPPVHAWACWRVYKLTGPRGRRDRTFLARTFQKLLINFTWWVNRKDVEGKHVFGGGFLGLDNIGVFDRSQPLPTGGHLEQADGTAWMAFYCATMLSMALELAQEDKSYEDVATKFFEHFVAISDAMHTLGGSGLWDEQDGFYYDQLHAGDQRTTLRVRSMVGLIPLYASLVLDEETLEALPDFRRRMDWFIANRPDLGRHIALGAPSADGTRRLLALPSRERLARVMERLLDETEFLSPHGVRSVSAVHREQPFTIDAMGRTFGVEYLPGESNSGLFGGNSNWRGPIWFPVNYLLVEALERYGHFYGDSLTVECPRGSGRQLTLGDVAMELSRRLSGIFLPDESGARPCHAGDPRYATDPHWKDLVLFNEYFHGDTGAGVGASHQTGWTALVTESLHDIAAGRAS